MGYGKVFRADALRSLAFGGIGAAYAPVGTQFDHPARQVLIQNLTDATLMFSFDGVNDHFPILSNGYLILDVSSNKIDSSGWFFSKNTRVNVKNIGTPTTGTVYVSMFYGQGD